MDRAALPPHPFFTQNAVKGFSSGSSVRLLSPVGKCVPDPPAPPQRAAAQRLVLRGPKLSLPVSFCHTPRRRGFARGLWEMTQGTVLPPGSHFRLQCWVPGEQASGKEGVCVPAEGVPSRSQEAGLEEWPMSPAPSGAALCLPPPHARGQVGTALCPKLPAGHRRRREALVPAIVWVLFETWDPRPRSHFAHGAQGTARFEKGGTWQEKAF